MDFNGKYELKWLWRQWQKYSTTQHGEHLYARKCLWCSVNDGNDAYVRFSANAIHGIAATTYCHNSDRRCKERKRRKNRPSLRQFLPDDQLNACVSCHWSPRQNRLFRTNHECNCIRISISEPRIHRRVNWWSHLNHPWNRWIWKKKKHINNRNRKDKCSWPRNLFGINENTKRTNNNLFRVPFIIVSPLSVYLITKYEKRLLVGWVLCADDHFLDIAWSSTLIIQAHQFML